MTGKSITILGAGPTGLSAAIALHARGHQVRILERNPAGTNESRAVGINRRSMKHFATVDVDAAISAVAKPLRRARFFINGKTAGTMVIPPLSDGSYMMVALPQDVTEKILGNHLSDLGIAIAWNTEAVSVTQTADQAAVTANGPDGEIKVASDYVLGADGSRSLTRKTLGANFDGFKYDGDWSLLDAKVDWPWPEMDAAVRLDDPDSVLVMITLGTGRHRFIGNTLELEEKVRSLMPVKDVNWRNEFTLSERRVDRYGDRRIWLAGDAAHIHSPAGGMGMNLGIDDAFDFARAVTEGDFARYNDRRIAAATEVLKRADRGFRLMTARNPLLKGFRNLVIRTVTSSPFLQRRLMAVMTSSDDA